MKVFDLQIWPLLSYSKILKFNPMLFNWSCMYVICTWCKSSCYKGIQALIEQTELVLLIGDIDSIVETDN